VGFCLMGDSTHPQAVLAVLAAALIMIGASGCSLSSSSAVSSAASVSNAGRHWVTVLVGRSRAYPAGALALPLTVVCKTASGTGGLKQVIRAAPRPGTSALYDGATMTDSLVVAVTSAGAIQVKC
jgi:hypothetical protein